MSKTENPIKFIYATKLDNKTLKFITKKLKVAKECSSYITLEDGRRITSNNIYDLFVEGSCDYYERDVTYSLSREKIVYTLKPISKEIKDQVKEIVIEKFKENIESRKRQLANEERTIEELKKRLAEAELFVKEIKDKITEQEANLAKLLKL